MSEWRRRVRRRTEVLIFFPVALVILAALAAFTLVAHRRAVDELLDERRAEALRAVRRVATDLAAAERPTAEALRRAAPEAVRVALSTPEGRVLATAGSFGGEDLLAPLGRVAPTEPVAVGPGPAVPDVVAAFAPLGPPEARRILRVDLSAAALALQQRNARTLTWVLLAAEGALIVLVLLFLRHLVAPWEALLARARAVGDAGAEEDDELAFLLATFERAVAALSRPRETAEDDIAALERALAPSLESGLLLLDRVGGVLALNPVGAHLLGVEPPAPGTPVAEALAGQPAVAGLLSQVVLGGRAVHREECTLTVDGRERTLGLTAHPLRRDDASVRGHLVLFADLTEARRRADEERLAESLAQLGELAAGVAHELRNSLATLRGYLALIERRPEEERITDYIQEIRTEADHLQRVLEDFLSFARPGSARLEAIDLARVVRRAAADPALDGVEVEVAAAAEGPELKGDPQLLERAVRNLLHNAVQAQRAAGESGPVEVRIAAAADGVEVAVADRGAGLPEGVRTRLFQPFAAGRAGGVGLGLALAHRIVTLHGGRLRLEDRPGGGTRAVIAFPAEPPA